MRFRISHLFILTAVIAIAVALWVFEHGKSVAVDAGYEIPVTIVTASGIDANISYALIDESNLDEILNNCSVWRDYETDKLHPADRELPKIPDFNLIVEGTTSVFIPATTMRSPLLKRNLGSSQPFDCIVIWIKHEFGTSYVIKYEWNWVRDQSITINVESQIPMAKQLQLPSGNAE